MFWKANNEYIENIDPQKQSLCCFGGKMLENDNRQKQDHLQKYLKDFTHQEEEWVIVDMVKGCISKSLRTHGLERSFRSE